MWGMSTVTIWFCSFVLPASAVRLALEPQNKVLFGPSWIDGGYGASLSIESRLTQLVSVNVGSTLSFSENIGNNESEDPQDWIKLNHAIWAAPGWRIPHRYRDEGLKWDVVFRGGFGCVFTSDSYIRNYMLIDPAGLAGVDLYIRKENWGIRSSSKAFIYQPAPSKGRKTITTQRFQSSVEVFWVWG